MPRLLARCSFWNSGQVSNTSTGTTSLISYYKRITTTLCTNKHSYYSLLSRYRQSAPQTSTMEVKRLLCLARWSAATIRPAITISALQNSGSHYRTKGCLIDWLTDMNFQRPSGGMSNQRKGSTIPQAHMDSDEDPSGVCGEKELLLHASVKRFKNDCFSHNG